MTDDYYQELFQLDQHILSILEEVVVAHKTGKSNSELVVKERKSFGVAFNTGEIRQMIEFILSEFSKDETKAKFLKT